MSQAKNQSQKLFWFRRKQVLTHRAVQMKLISVFFFWFLLFIAAFGFIFLENFASVSSKTTGMRIHDELVTKMLLVAQTKDLFIWYGIAAFGYMILVCTYLLAYSNRITGPVYKMTKMMEKATETGEWPNDLRFRKGDAFPELAKAFNAFVVAMKSKK